MARKPKRSRKTANKRPETFDEENLTKGQLRKLNALRKSVGEEIGNEAFKKWLSQQNSDRGASVDKNAALIVNTLEPLINTKKLRIPRGGYLLTRGRGRIIITRPEQT